jgi:hypothetical protein
MFFYAAIFPTYMHRKHQRARVCAFSTRDAIERVNSALDAKMVTANFFLAADGETRSLASVGGRTFGNEKQARCACSASWPASTGLIFMYRGGRAPQLARSVVVECIVFGYSSFHSPLFPLSLRFSFSFVPSRTSGGCSAKLPRLYARPKTRSRPRGVKR